MTAKNNLSKPVMIDVLKRLIKKFSTSNLSKPEKIDVLRRLITKLSTSRLSKPEKIDVLKRLIKKFSTEGASQHAWSMTVLTDALGALLGKNVTREDAIKAVKNLSDENKK